MSENQQTFLSQFEAKLFDESEQNFNDLSIELFRFQAINNSVYKNYLQLINCEIESIRNYQNIPFLPISAFKTHQLKCGEYSSEATFSSSGTSGHFASQHFVKNLSVYQNSFQKAFERFYGSIGEYCVLGLLPSYLERKGSSLIYMVNDFINRSNAPESGFFLNNQQELYRLLSQLNQAKRKVLLIGVSFALLDFTEKYQLSVNKNLIVMETGGMKGKRKELIREDLHAILKKGFSTKSIHSEYGMTELLSQGYSRGNGFFKTPPWMKVLIREQDDPFSYVEDGKAGVINIIDLANTSSCAFIQTDDLGRIQEEQGFEVLGRQDASDVRGCNLMVN